MVFEVLVLGSNAAVPAWGRHPSAQVLSYHNKRYLIDCGEGTQMRMNAFGVKRGAIDQIFISHLHGDHVFGLIGLLTSLSLNDRLAPLQVFAPAGLEEIIEVHKKHCQIHFSYPLEIIALQTGKIFEDKHLTVSCFPLLHGVPTFGFRFDEKPGLLNIRAEAIEAFGIDIMSIKSIKEGKDFVNEAGEVIGNELLTHPPKALRSYAYCSDTAYAPSIVPFIENVSMLYHEATFLSGQEESANKYGHSTLRQAVAIAELAKAKKLLVGHISSRYPDVRVFYEETTTSPFAVVVEGLSYPIFHPSE